MRKMVILTMEKIFEFCLHRVVQNMLIYDVVDAIFPSTFRLAIAEV